MGVPQHLIVTITSTVDKQLLLGQNIETEWFCPGKSVRQGCISLYLFSLYAEHIIWKAILNSEEGGVKNGGRNISNLRYADYTILLAERSNNLK